MKLIKAADRTSRHLIRSTTLAAIAAALATIIALVMVASGNNSAVAASSLNNGNFETGDLTGWAVTASGGYASAVASYDYCYPYVGEGCWELASIPPQEGSYFALLTPGGNMSEATRISQPFEASNGDKVSGWAFFKSENYAPPGEKGQVVITSDSGATVATPFEQSVSSGSYYGTWTYWEYTFSGLTGTGQFQIEARVQNDPTASYACWCSHLGLDDVKMSTNGPDTTKPTTSATHSVEPNGVGWNNEDVTVKLNATDNEGGWGVKELTYRINGGQPITKQGPLVNSAINVEVPVTAEGTTTLTYYATDKAENVEDQKTHTVKIDKTAPWVYSTSPANNARGTAADKISVTFLESGAGIDPSTFATNTYAFEVYRETRLGGERVSGSISFDESTQTATFTPSSKLVKGASYRVYIRGQGGRLGDYRNSGVWDKADNTLSTVNDAGYTIFEYTWSFKN